MPVSFRTSDGSVTVFSRAELAKHERTLEGLAPMSLRPSAIDRRVEVLRERQRELERQLGDIERSDDLSREVDVLERQVRQLEAELRQRRAAAR